MKEEVEGEKKGGEGLEGEDFPGKFRETPRPPDQTRTSFAQNQRPPPVRGRSPTPSLPLAYAHMGAFAYFYYFYGISVYIVTFKIVSHIKVHIKVCIMW